MKAAGKLEMIDNVIDAFARVRSMTKIARPPKLFRKTMTSLLKIN